VLGSDSSPILRAHEELGTFDEAGQLDEELSHQLRDPLPTSQKDARRIRRGLSGEANALKWLGLFSSRL